MTGPAEQGSVATSEAPVLTAASLAKRWGISPRTVINLIVRGDLHGTQIGKQWRVTESDAATYEQRRRPNRVACPQDAGVAS